MLFYYMFEFIEGSFRFKKGYFILGIQIKESHVMSDQQNISTEICSQCKIR